MHKPPRKNASLGFASNVLLVLTALVVGPMLAVLSIPAICFMAPVALIAIPFMLVAFFGQSKEALPATQPLCKLQPQASH